MPDIRQNSTIEALARAFTSNGRKQEQAMVDVEYTPAYANSYCGKMWENARLKAAIARIDAKQGKEQGRTVQNLDEMYQAIYDQAKGLKQPSAAVSAVTGLARLYGMDKDNQVQPDKPTDLTADELDALRADAKRLTDLKLRTGL